LLLQQTLKQVQGDGAGVQGSFKYRLAELVSASPFITTDPETSSG